MDIRSGSGWPSSALSNFAPHPFVFDGVSCMSMEGFLQSLKFNKPHIQKHICTLVGRMAKQRGRGRNWKRQQLLWWNGTSYDRHGPEYLDLLARAFTALCDQSNSFRKALLATGSATLTHSIGSTNPRETILTAHEFCSILHALRADLRRHTKVG